jgi:hypothetical protein
MDAPKPESASSRRRFWFDPRFAIGLVLVVASVAGVLAIVSTSDSSDLIYATRDSLAPGDRIEEADLLAIAVNIEGGGSAQYLAPGDVPDEGLVVTRTVAAGELVPTSALGDAAGLRLASIVVSVNGQLPKSVEPGSTVDLWSSRSQEASEFGAPSVIVPSAIVVREVESEGLVASGDVTTVELLVPRLRIARVLEAIANKDALSIVPSSIPVKS